MAKRILVLFLLLHVAVQAQTRWELKPGIGLGPVKLGMTLPELEGVLGQPTDRVGSEKSPIFVFFGELVVLLEAGKARMISIHATELKLKSGTVTLAFPARAGVGDSHPGAGGRTLSCGGRVETYVPLPGLGLRIHQGVIEQVDIVPLMEIPGRKNSDPDWYLPGDWGTLAGGRPLSRGKL